MVIKMGTKDGSINISLEVLRPFHAQLKGEYPKMSDAFHDVYEMFVAFVKTTPTLKRNEIKEKFETPWQLVNAMEKI